MSSRMPYVASVWGLGTLRNSLDSGLVSESDSVVLFNTATGLKHPMPDVESRVDKQSVDYSFFDPK